VGETVVFNVSANRKTGPHRRFHEWADRAGFSLYIGREVRDRRTGQIRFEESDWHNPHTVEEHGRDDSLRLYEEQHLRNSLELRARIPELQGKALCCWCAPKHACHGHVLARLANAYTPPGAACEAPVGLYRARGDVHAPRFSQRRRLRD
jgi:hypothetical protein